MIQGIEKSSLLEEMLMEKQKNYCTGSREPIRNYFRIWTMPGWNPTS